MDLSPGIKHHKLLDEMTKFLASEESVSVNKFTSRVSEFYTIDECLCV